MEAEEDLAQKLRVVKAELRLVQRDKDNQTNVIRNRDKKIAQLQEQIATKDPVKKRLNPYTWIDDINSDGNTMESREKLYWKSCIAGNMSKLVVHPDLVLRSGKAQPERKKCSARIPVIPFPFLNLPPNIQIKIFKIWLVKPDMIHAISRMCPKGSAEVNQRARDGFPRRFHWSKGSCAIAQAKEPGEVLKLLLVSKDFLHMGATTFYAHNTFGFSSTGEFGRFIKGIGEARSEDSVYQSMLDRCQNATREIRWWHSVRSRPFHQCPLLLRLKFLEIHIDEGPERLRRPYEEDSVQRILISASCGQDNRRGRRSLRAVQGFDYFYQYRGLRKVDMWDYSARPYNKKISVVDQEFLHSFRKQAMLPKKQEDMDAALEKHLSPFLKFYRPGEVVKQAIRYLYRPRWVGPDLGPFQFSMPATQNEQAMRETLTEYSNSDAGDDMHQKAEEDDDERLTWVDEVPAQPSIRPRWFQDRFTNAPKVAGLVIDSGEAKEDTKEKSTEPILNSIEHNVTSSATLGSKEDSIDGHSPLPDRPKKDTRRLTRKRKPLGVLQSRRKRRRSAYGGHPLWTEADTELGYATP